MPSLLIKETRNFGELGQIKNRNLFASGEYSYRGSVNSVSY